jgi:hypothetical protein
MQKFPIIGASYQFAWHKIHFREFLYGFTPKCGKLPAHRQKPAALFVLVSILPKLLLALMGRNFAQFAFSSAGHFSVSFWLSRRFQNKIRKPPRMLG